MTLVLEGSAAMAAAVLGAYCRECTGRLFSSSGCLAGCCSFGLRKGGKGKGKRPWSSREADREEFERLIAFLSVVPIFQKQLPRADLPIVAQALRRQSWKPGEKVISQGDEGRAFFIIQAGEASVIVADPNGESSVRARLYNGDYFGGHTLTEKRPNVATIVCKGPTPLETLSLSREDFQRLGLHRKLKFPARPAIYEGRQITDGQRVDDSAIAGGAGGGGSTPLGRQDSVKEGDENLLTEEEIDFICRAVMENGNIRTRGELAPEKVRSMAETARKKKVPEGSELLKGGELGHDFFIVEGGGFEVFPVRSGLGSVEARLASSTIHDRLARKQEFLVGVLKKGDPNLRLSGKLRNAPAPSGMSEKRRVHTSMRVVGNNNGADEVLGSRQSRNNGGSGGPSGGSTGISRRTQARSAAEQGMRWVRSASARYHADDMESPFAVGDSVARVVAGEVLMKEVGKVTEIVEAGADGEVMVEFPGKTGLVSVQVTCLRPVEGKAPIATLTRGVCIGELALLYNVRQIASFRAREESEVFVIKNKTFKECFSRETTQFREFCRLLDEVHMLTPLVRGERAELARNSTGLLKFAPGEWVLKKGEVPEEKLWYVVEKGSGTLTRDIVDSEELQEGVVSELHRNSHFGEDEIFQRLSKSSVSVQAGPAGMTCLVFDAEILRNIHSLEVDQKGNILNYTPNIIKRRTMSMVRLEEFSLVAVLGEGGFGSVFLARHGSREYALKRMSKGYIVEQNMQKQICAERDILSLIDSPFIIQFYRSYQDGQYLYMLLEYAMGGHLYSLMCDRPHILTQDEPRGSAAMFFVACVTCALEHLHERNIVYRDLKPENILLDGHGIAKICDLGFARFVLGKTNTMVGTPEYMAPEMIDSPHAHDSGVDWWALGVLTFELLTLQVPFNAPDCEDMMVKLVCIRREQDSGIPEKLLPNGLILPKDFIKNLCSIAPDRRLGRGPSGGQQVKRHAWFTYQKFDFSDLRACKIKGPHATSKKVVERILPSVGTITSLNAADKENALFVKYNDDGSKWDDNF